MSADVVALRAGEVFHDRYVVVRRIAAGGMGAVYEVIHQGTQRRCAMKLMLPSLVKHPELRARFQTEATIAAKIGSEHIVDVFDAGVDAATSIPFLVMELLDGRELGALIKEKGPLPPKDALVLLQQAAFALGKTHAAGIVHRDLKPENMFVTRRDDGSPRLKILDFGIARVIAESGRATNHTGMLGTPTYMAPEQVDALAPLTAAADTFALAHVAYTMLVGEIYWEEEAVVGAYKLVMKVLAGIPESPVSRARRRKNVLLPPAFDGWFARSTASSPTDRFQSAQEQVTALAAVLGGMQGLDVATPTTLASPAQPPSPEDSHPISSTLPRPDPQPGHTLPMRPLVAEAEGAPKGLTQPFSMGLPQGLTGSGSAMRQRPSEAATRVSGPSAPVPSAGTTTMPVSSDAITRRMEKTDPPRSKRPFLIAAILAVVAALGTWVLLRGKTPSLEGSLAAPGESSTGLATSLGALQASASPSSTSMEPRGAPATSSSSSTTGSSTASTSASTRSSTAKPKPKATGSSRNPLDEGM